MTMLNMKKPRPREVPVAQGRVATSWQQALCLTPKRTVKVPPASPRPGTVWSTGRHRLVNDQVSSPLTHRKLNLSDRATITFKGREKGRLLLDFV